MKSFLTRVFVVLGIIFLIIIFIGLYFFVADPYNLKPMLFGSGVTVKSLPQNTDTSDNGNTSDAVTEQENVTNTTGTTGGFELTAAQKQALLSFGIDPATVPASISAQQEACFVSVLGTARVVEIKAGAVPNVFEFLKAKACI